MVGESWNEQIVGDITVRDIILSARWSKEGYMESVVKPSHEGGETELILLAAMRGSCFMTMGIPGRNTDCS